MQTLTSKGKGMLTVGIAVVVVVAAIALITRGSDAAESQQTSSVLELSLGESDSFASCLQYDVEVLADMPVAFEGTVTAVDGSAVTLAVDRWFNGTGVDVVDLIGEHQDPALIAGFEFEPGVQYLVAATDGRVNYCGYSGIATPELRAGYEAAFAG
jgi:hypothetical protein